MYRNLPGNCATEGRSSRNLALSCVITHQLGKKVVHWEPEVVHWEPVEMEPMVLMKQFLARPHEPGHCLEQ